MKGIIFLMLLLFAICSDILGQSTFTLSELERMSGYSQAGFESYVANKSFSRDEITSAGAAVSYSTASLPKDIISWSSSGPLVSSLISLTTFDVSTYSKMVDSMRDYSYKMIRTENLVVDGKLQPVYFYSNGKYLVTLSTSASANGLGICSIQIGRLKKN